MSLNSFLNSEKTNNPKPAIARVIRRVVAPTPKEEPKVKRIDINSNSTQTPPTSSTKVIKSEKSDRDEDILTFSIVAKIFLPKEVADRIDMLFMKMILGKISFQTLSSNVSNLVSNHRTVFQLWNVILNRNMNITDPLALKISEIVHWFYYNGMMPLMCISFIKFVIDSKQKGISKIKLFSLLLNQESAAYPTVLIKDILKFALELYPLLPSSNYHSHQLQLPFTPVPVTLGLHPFSHDFLIPKRIPDITTNPNKKNYSTTSPMPKSSQIQQSSGNDGSNDSNTLYSSIGNEKGTGNQNSGSNANLSQTPSGGTSHHRHSAPPPIKFTPSHNQNLISMPMNNGFSFIFNFMTKSTQVGHEGGSHPNPHYHVEAPPPTRDLHELLESMEVLEHAIDEIEGFDEDCQQYNYVIYGAGKYIYNQYWSEIEQFLPSLKVRKFIIRRCRNFLQQIYDDLLEAQHFSRSYLETQPTNGFFCSLVPPKLNSPFSIDFKFYETSVSHYLKMLITSYPAEKHKYTSILWFIKKILPRFQVVTLLQQLEQQNQNHHQQSNYHSSYQNMKNYHNISDHTAVAIFGPKSLACVLWYFSLLCETISPIFKYEPSLMGTWDAVLDFATEQVRNKFSIEGNKSNNQNSGTFSNERERSTSSNYHQNNTSKNSFNNQTTQSYSKSQHSVHLHQRGSKKQLTRILKSIIANRTIIDEMADEVSKHFGKLSQNISHFFPIFSRLNRAASWYRNDPHRKKFTKCAERFGYARGPNAAQELDALRPLYRSFVTFPSNEKIYLFKFDFEKDKIFVIPK